jgi:BMFP domain-containing protein YqiC
MASRRLFTNTAIQRVRGKKILQRHARMDVRMNLSHESKDSLLLEYRYRVEALQKQVAFLEAQLENFNNQINKNT